MTAGLLKNQAESENKEKAIIQEEKRSVVLGRNQNPKLLLVRELTDKSSHHFPTRKWTC